MGQKSPWMPLGASKRLPDRENLPPDAKPLLRAVYGARRAYASEGGSFPWDWSNLRA